MWAGWVKSRVSVLWVTGLALMQPSCGGYQFIGQVDEVAHSVGDALASLDEMLVVSGAALSSPGLFHSEHGEEETDLTGPERLSCLQTTPLTAVSCSSGIRTWTLDGECSSGLRTALTGTVTFRYSANDCGMGTVGTWVTRQPSYLQTGKKMGELIASSSAQGQVLTKTPAGYDFVIQDLERLFYWPDNEGNYPMSVSTPSSWIITGGQDRSSRVVTSGSLRLVQHRLGWTANVAITSPLVFSSTCNCAVSGTLTGAVTGEEEDDQLEVEIQSCGVALIREHGMHSFRVKLDRCAPVNW